MKHDRLDGEISAAEEAATQRRFDDAVRVLTDTSSRRPLTSAELVLLGRSVQLSENCQLSQARDAFERAIAADGSNVTALLELAWFLYSVENDAGAARPLFERAMKLSRDSLRESVGGLVRCVAAEQSEVAAKELLAKLVEALVDQKDVLRNANIPI